MLRVLLPASGRGSGQVREPKKKVPVLNWAHCAGVWLIFRLIFFLQWRVVYKDHGRGPSLPGEPGRWPHPKPNRLLPDEHPHHSTIHLPLPPRWERPQHQGTHRRRLRLVHSRERGVLLWMFVTWFSIVLLFKNISKMVTYPSSMPNVWGSSLRNSRLRIWKFGPVRWRELSKQRSASECRTNSGSPWMKSMLYVNLNVKLFNALVQSLNTSFYLIIYFLNQGCVWRNDVWGNPRTFPSGVCSERPRQIPLPLS